MGKFLLFFSDKYKLYEGHLVKLRQMVEAAYGNSKKFKNKKARRLALEEIMNWVLECITYSEIIIPFDIRR